MYSKCPRGVLKAVFHSSLLQRRSSFKNSGMAIGFKGRDNKQRGVFIFNCDIVQGRHGETKKRSSPDH